MVRCGVTPMPFTPSYLYSRTRARTLEITRGSSLAHTNCFPPSCGSCFTSSSMAPSDADFRHLQLVVPTLTLNNYVFWIIICTRYVLDSFLYSFYILYYIKRSFKGSLNGRYRIVKGPVGVTLGCVFFLYSPWIHFVGDLYYNRS
jgi:hypothetical protein